MKKTLTKHKILTAAKQLFAEHGFAGTSIGKIAKLAEINHSLIFHHFKNKEDLWHHVKQSTIRDNHGISKTLPEITLPFHEFLQRLFTKCIRFYRQNPDLIRMINWQRLERNQNNKIGVTLSTETKAWLDAFKHYQKIGNIHKKYKPEFIITLILSIISSTALDPSVFINKSKDFEPYIDFCISQLEKSLK